MDNTLLCPSSPSTSTYAASSTTSSFGFRRRESTVTEISQASSVYEEPPDLPRFPIPKKPPEVVLAPPPPRSRIASLAVPPPRKSSITFLEPRKMSLPGPSTPTMSSHNSSRNAQLDRRSSVATLVPRPTAAYTAHRDKPLPSTDPPFPISRLRNFRSAPSLRKDDEDMGQNVATGARRGSLLPQGFTSRLARFKRS